MLPLRGDASGLRFIGTKRLIIAGCIFGLTFGKIGVTLVKCARRDIRDTLESQGNIGFLNRSDMWRSIYYKIEIFSICRCDINLVIRFYLRSLIISILCNIIRVEIISIHALRSRADIYYSHRV